MTGRSGHAKSGQAKPRRGKPAADVIDRAVEEVRERRKQLWRDCGGSYEAVIARGERVLAERAAAGKREGKRRKSA